MGVGVDRAEAPVRSFGFGRADEHPYRRLVGDWVRLGLAVLLLVGSVRWAETAHPVERDLVRLVADVPEGVREVLRWVLAVGTLWGVALVAVAALVLRRVRLAIALAGAGALAWCTARLVGHIAVHDRFGDALDAMVRSSRLGRFPVVHLAVLGAVLLAAAPFLSRPLRRAGTALLWLVVLGALSRELGTPNAVFASVVIAWGSAAALHLIVGSPAGRPTPRQVAAALAQLGVPSDDVALASVQDRGFTRMVARTGGEDLSVRVYGRDAAETRLAAKLWRAIVYKDSGPTLTFTRLQQVEHEALSLLRARDAGVTVPDLVAVGVAGPSAAVLVTGGADLRPVACLAPEGPDADDLVRAVWSAAAHLRGARIAHGALDADHLAIDATGGLVVTDFSMASVAGSDAHLDADVAQALVTTAALVGPARAVELAAAAMGTDVVADARRFLSRPALTSANRRTVRAHRDLLAALTGAVSDATGREPEAPIELRRVKPLNAVMFVAAALAVWVVLAQVGSVSDLWATLRTARIPWAAGGFVAAQATAVAFALVTIGSVPEAVPLLPATLLQMAISFANMVAATSVSSTVMNIRFLQRQGVEVGAATSSGVLAGLSGTVAQFSLFVISALAVGEELRLGEIGGDGDGRLVLVVVAVVTLLVGIALAVPRLRRLVRGKVWPQVLGAVRNLWGILTTPRQLVLVLGGSLAAQLLYAVCLTLCLSAYGASLSFLEVVFVNASAAFLANLTPVPGGMGIQEAAMIAGLGAFGVAPDIATATVVTHRLFTTYLPPIWGSIAMKKLLADGYL